MKCYRFVHLTCRLELLYLGKSKKVHFQQYYSYTLLIIFVISEENKLIQLPTPPEYVITLTCKLLNFFIWLKVCCVLSNVGGSERASCGLSSVALKMTSYDVWQLECQGSSVIASVHFIVTIFCANKRFQSFSTLISRIVHHAVLKFNPCRNKPLPQGWTCLYQYTRETQC